MYDRPHPQSLTGNPANEIGGFQSVMPGLVPGIHDFHAANTWMAGINPAMTDGEGPDNSERISSQVLRSRAPWRGVSKETRVKHALLSMRSEIVLHALRMRAYPTAGRRKSSSLHKNGRGEPR